MVLNTNLNGLLYPKNTILLHKNAISNTGIIYSVNPSDPVIRPPYYAFTTDYTLPYVPISGTTDCAVGIDVQTLKGVKARAICLDMIAYCNGSNYIGSFVLQGSDDNTSWTNISDVYKMYAPPMTNPIEHKLWATNSNYYRYLRVRMYGTSAINLSGSYEGGFISLNFFGVLQG